MPLAQVQESVGGQSYGLLLCGYMQNALCVNKRAGSKFSAHGAKARLLYVYEFCERDRKEFERCPNLEDTIKLFVMPKKVVPLPAKGSQTLRIEKTYTICGAWKGI